jgi:glycosyltransferase involved in cell wall biosynthesis
MTTKLSIVLQSTGEHSWNVSGGWVNAARRLGVLHHVFTPRGPWDEPVKDDNGLAQFLKDCDSDVILMPGFDWHSQPLHNTPEWRIRWRKCRAKKVLIGHESIHGDEKLTNTSRAFVAAAVACECGIDLFVYNDIGDRALVHCLGIPNLYQPFGVDLDVFKAEKPYAARQTKPFFRGKVEFEFMPGVPVYQDRRRLVKHLQYRELIDVQRFEFDKPLDPAMLAGLYNDRRIVVNFPSVFPGHPTRVTEAMACGCCVLTNLTGVPELDKEFTNRKHLFYYDPNDAVALEDRVRFCMANQDVCEYVAQAGRRMVESTMGLDKLLGKILEKVAV